VALAIGAVLGSAEAAAAGRDTPPAAEPSATDKERAAAHFRRGEAAFKAHDYERAAAAFLEAHRSQPHPAALFNAARSFEKAGQLARAANLCARYLERAPPRDKRRPDAGELIALLTPKLGRVSVEAPGGSGLTLDDEPIELDPTWVDPGDHVAAARFDGRLVERKLSVVAGSLVRVVIEPPGDEPATGEPPEREPARHDHAPQPSARPLAPAWFWGGVAVTGIVGGATLWSGLDTRSAREDYDRNPTREGLDDGEAKQARTNLLLAAAAVCAGATAVAGLFFVDFGSARKSRDARAMLRVAPGAIGVAGRF
jgi:tetratricopeptide (TPR) repeat protein